MSSLVVVTPIPITQVVQPSTPVRTSLVTTLAATGKNPTSLNSFLKSQLPVSGNSATTGYASPAGNAYLKQELAYLVSNKLIILSGDDYNRLGRPVQGGAGKDGTGLPMTYETLDTLNISGRLP